MSLTTWKAKVLQRADALMDNTTVGPTCDSCGIGIGTEWSRLCFCCQSMLAALHIDDSHAKTYWADLHAEWIKEVQHKRQMMKGE